MDPQLDPQPLLLLGLPLPVLHTLLDKLRSRDKVTLMRTCKQARTDVLQHATQITFSIDDKKPGKQSGAGLAALLATRTEPLHLTLDLAWDSDKGTTQMMAQLATQQYPDSTPQGCVRKLDILLPPPYQVGMLHPCTGSICCEQASLVLLFLCRFGPQAALCI